MANWDDIREEWENNKITLKSLAKKHGVKLGTLKSRKSREKWSREKTENKGATDKEKVATKNKKDATSKRGAPKGNKNAVGNEGGAPKGNKNGVGNSGGAPRMNRNAVTTGEYETIMWDYLDDDEKELFESIETDPLYQIDIKIRELSLRERRMMKRIRALEDGLTEKERRVLQELKDSKDIHVIENKDGVEMHVPVPKSALVITQIEETEYRKIDDVLNLEDALTRVTNQLVKAIKQKHDMDKAYNKHPLELELLEANIEKIRAEADNLEDDTDEQPIEVVIKRKGDN
ncbi:phage terminase small subunit [Lentibacillus sp. N15]|uniref:phage terminase small subunit n=1 Tax=Lentibacillus songyuanensis TaxID=3136161 RepID=UPI0031BADC0B